MRFLAASLVLALALAMPPAGAQSAPLLAAPKSVPAETAVAPSQPTQLDAYLNNLKTLRASFLQTLADGQGGDAGHAALGCGRRAQQLHYQRRR